jgi:hypothetical protein
MGRVTIRKSTIIIVFGILTTFAVLNAFTFMQKLEKINNEKNKFTSNVNSIGELITQSEIPNNENPSDFGKNVILKKILIEGKASSFEKNELLDNYTRISIDNFGLKENVPNSNSMGIKEIYLPQTDGKNDVPILAINDISSINYTIHTKLFLNAQCQYEGNHFENDMVNKTNGIFLIFIVISSPQNFEQRNIIRNTWAKKFQKKATKFTNLKGSNF